MMATILALVLAGGCASRGSTAAAKSVTPPESPWTLRWSDEFEKPGAPDSTRWGFFTGMTKPKCPVVFTRRRENVRVEKGCLVLETRHETFRNPSYKPGSTKPRQQVETAPYTSGRVETRGRFNWTYGRLEIRARIPVARGLHVAMWTMGRNYEEVNWPRCGEIDVLEYLGRTPQTAWQVVHFADDAGAHVGRSNQAPAPFADGKFHTLALEWDEDQVEWFVDGRAVWRFRVDEANTKEGNPYRMPHFLILNLSVGGWGEDPVPEDYPARMEVDYVRVYSRNPPATPAR